MNLITLLNPPKLIFGENAYDRFIDDLLTSRYKRLYILGVEDVSEFISPGIDRLRTKGIEVRINNDIRKEPSFADFETILADARNFNADSIAGIGGGSVLDTAKLVAAQLLNDQPLSEIKGNGLLKERRTYLVCIPGTSGTGSEVSPNAIFTDEYGAKTGVISPFLVPDASYIDPALTLSVPRAVTAATGIDALTHCLEAYANNFAHPVTDLIALEGIRLVASCLKRACDDGNDLEARSQLALASMYGGMCLGPVNTAAVHALAYPLGAGFNLGHGLSIALLLPAVMEYTMPEALNRYADIARALGAKSGASLRDTAEEGVLLLKQLIRDCGLPGSLREAGVTREALPRMAGDSMKVQRLLKNNLREITEEGALEIYNRAF